MAKRTTMNVSLTPALEKFVHKLVKSGQYQSSSEVVRESLRSLEQENKRKARALKEFLKTLDQSEDDIKNGRSVDGPTFMNGLRASINAQIRTRRRRAS